MNVTAPFGGTPRTIRGHIGERLLTTLKRHGHHLEGACGGNMDCGTCHVYIDPKWRAAVGAPSGPSAPADVRHARRRPFSNGRSVAGPGCGTARGGAGPAGRAALQQRTVGSNGAWTARSPAQALTLAIHPSCLCAPKQVGPLLPSGAHQGARRPGRRAAACAGDSTCTLAASNDATDTHTHTHAHAALWRLYRQHGDRKSVV